MAKSVKATSVWKAPKPKPPENWVKTDYAQVEAQIVSTLLSGRKTSPKRGRLFALDRVPVNRKKLWSKQYPSSSSGNIYTTVVWGDLLGEPIGLTCDCPGWVMARKGIRTCRHITSAILEYGILFNRKEKSE